MAETWPPSLQQVLNTGNFKEQDEDPTIRTKPGTGPIKIRRRFTQPETLMDGTIWIDETEYSVLKDFVNNTLKNRTLPFNFNHPITGVLTEYRFDKPEVVSPIGNALFVCKMTWREGP